MKSFIFHYDKKEIYNLKNKGYAIYCSADYGPTFGGGHDFIISNDFNGGYSKLGYSYDTSKYTITDKTTHLFGDKKPQIKECKVYKIIFK